MIIKRLTMGSFQVNNYLLVDEKTHDAVLIDAGGDLEATLDAIKENNANLKYILHTHAHMDHIAGDHDLQKATGAKVLLHKDDEFLVKVMKKYLAEVGMPDAEEPEVDGYIEDSQEITVGDITLKAIHTPGHSPGGLCFLSGDKLFSGDTLFADSVGRTDLPGGSYEQLMVSIGQKLFKLNDEVTVYPGHGRSTSIGHEKHHNPFFGS